MFLGLAVVLTALLGGVALWLGAWAFDYRRRSLHYGRLKRLLERKPHLDQVVEALRNEASPLVAAPEDEPALRAAAERHGGTMAAEVIAKGTRYRHTRVFLAADMVYFIYFDDAGVMRDFTWVSR
jgi:hypothetical protein